MKNENYAIMRFAKIKNMNEIRRYDYHNTHREKLVLMRPENSIKNYSWCPAQYEFEQTVKARYKKASAGVKTRKNAVLAVEFVFAYSPTARVKISDWMNANKQFLAKNFGGEENIIDITLHLDESSPHAHALIIPKADEKLSWMKFINGPADCVKLQTKYAEEMAQFGLKRGKQKMKNTNIKKYITPHQYWQEKAEEEIKTLSGNQLADYILKNEKGER